MQGLYNKINVYYASIEALKLPYGGITYMAKFFGCSRQTIRPGIKDYITPGFASLPLS